MQASGVFQVDAAPPFAAQLFPQLAGGGPPPTMSGSGFWDETGQAILFSLQCSVAGPRQTIVFTGYQVHPPTGADPAQDLVWTLVGEFRHGFGSQAVVISDESARRFIFGWYAQITQVV